MKNSPISLLCISLWAFGIVGLIDIASFLEEQLHAPFLWEGFVLFGGLLLAILALSAQEQVGFATKPEPCIDMPAADQMTGKTRRPN